MRNRKNPFKGHQFTSEVILWTVRWYLQFPISYHDHELMLRDRDVSVDHTTVYLWIQAYAPELERRLRPHLRPTNGSWRVDETYLKGHRQLVGGEPRVWRVTLPPCSVSHTGTYQRYTATP
jgi:IS6 family transposase